MTDLTKEELLRQKRKEKSQYRRDKIKAARPANLSKEDTRLMAEMYKVAKQLTDSTGIKHEVDHIVPLNKGGLETPENLQIITEEQNRSKGDRLLAVEGAILSNQVKEGMLRDKGKFIKGVSGNPNGRPKKVELSDKDQQKLFQFFIEAKGDQSKFKELIFEKGGNLKVGIEHLLKVMKQFEDIKVIEQKLNKTTEKPVTKLEITLLGTDEFKKIIEKLEV